MCDGASLAAQMAGFEATKAMQLTNAQREGAAALFTSVRADADDMSQAIRWAWENCGELIDPHTAIGLHAGLTSGLPREVPVVTLATAHPAKFGDAVERATGRRPSLPSRVGDLFVNYRYQLAGPEGAVAAAPRVSLLLPTGRAAEGSGADAWGVQVNLPVSVRLGDAAVTHWNAGATVLPRASNELGERATIRAYNLGASAIWLARSRFNVMLEASWTRAEEVVGPSTVRGAELFLVMPGVRWAHDFRSGLQVVPGVGYAFDVGSSGGDALVVYLSFEHGF